MPPSHPANRATPSFAGAYKQRQIGLSLFDLEADVGESTNISDQYPEVVQKLQTLCAAMKAELMDGQLNGPGVRPPGRVQDSRAHVPTQMIPAWLIPESGNPIEFLTSMGLHAARVWNKSDGKRKGRLELLHKRGDNPGHVWFAISLLADRNRGPGWIAPDLAENTAPDIISKAGFEPRR